MRFLQEMLYPNRLSEEVDDILPDGEQYIKAPPESKKKKKKTPINNAAQTSLINTIWAYNNADAV